MVIILIRLASSLGEGEYLSVESEQEEEDYLIPLQVYHHYIHDHDDVCHENNYDFDDEAKDEECRKVSGTDDPAHLHSFIVTSHHAVTRTLDHPDPDQYLGGQCIA